MPANKTAAEAEPRAVAKKKTTSTKNAAPARKSERRPVTKSVSPKKSATKKTPQKKTQPKKSSTPKPVAKKTSPAKAAAAKAPARPTKGASFDAEKRRKLIAAAAARRRKAVASKRESIKPEIIQHREPTPVERHKYAVGEGVRVVSTAGMWFKNGIDYKITAALPPAAGKLQYRIKNDGEPFERVVSESQLSPV